MATATLHDPYIQAEDASGVPVSGGLLYFYVANSTTDLTVYQDAGEGTPHAQPVVADASGLFPPVYVPGIAAYKTVLKTAGGVTIQTVDNIAVTSSAANSQPLDADLTIIANVGVAAFSGFRYGLQLANDSLDATNDMDIAAGVAIDSTNSDFLNLSAPIVKRLDANWVVGTNQGGRDTGSISNGTWYVWLIKRVDTGVVDVLYSLSSSSPTMPSNYTLKRRIGSIVRAAGAIAGIGVNSATSLVLDLLDLQIGDVVGTTTTTSITLQQGDWRVLRAQGTWPVTASASLVVDGSTTVQHTYSAGDLIYVEGGAGSVVYVWTDSTNILQHEYTITSTEFAPRLDNTVALGDGLHQFSGISIAGGGLVSWAAGGATLQGVGTAIIAGQNFSVTSLLTLTGGQAKFPSTQNASSDANTLDDYAEGTWTPVIAFGGASVAQTYSTQAGRSTKIGRAVVLEGQTVLTAIGSSTGAVTITGLPFASGIASTSCSVTGITGFSTLIAGLTGQFTGSTITIRIPNTTASAQAANTNFSSTSNITFSGVYSV